MLDVLVDSPAVLAAMIAILSLLNYAVSALALRDQSRQNFVQRDDHLPPGPVGKFRSHRAKLALPFFLAIVVIILTVSADRPTREMFGGGYLVVLVASFANLASFLSVRTLLNPAAAEGRIHYSAMYRYRSTGAQTLGFALFSGTVGILQSGITGALGRRRAGRSNHRSASSAAIAGQGAPASRLGARPTDRDGKGNKCTKQRRVIGFDAR